MLRHRSASRALLLAAPLLAFWASPGHAVDRLPPMVGIGAGAASACSLAGSGLVRCWGQNSLALLDASGTVVEPSAVLGGGLASGAQKIAVGDFHRCAIMAGTGALKCWGANATGAVGDGTTTDRTAATDVSGLAGGVIDVAAGDGFTCAVDGAGGVKCWGRNDFGQLGNGTTAAASVPVSVSGLSSGVLAVAAGSRHACAILAGGALKCWGRNDSGQLGNGGFVGSTTPVDVAGLGFGVSAASLGVDHSCAIGAGGALYCWGSGEKEKIGDGVPGSAPRPVPIGVAGLPSGVSAVSAGATHTCASAGATKFVKCWGANLNWRTGDPPSTATFPMPTDVPGLSNIGALAAGNGFQCTLAGDGRVRCWGDNSAGQLGTGNLAPPFAPSDVVDQEAILAVTTAGSGSGRVIPFPDAAGGTNSGYPVMLAAAPDYGSSFTGWGPGACSGVTGNVCSLVMAAPVDAGGVTMPGTTAVTAIFDATPVSVGLQLSPSSSVFPGTVVGTTGPVATFTLSNASTFPAAITQLKTTGDFAVSATSCGATLQATGTCTFQVRFTPTSLGPRTGSLSFVSDTAFGPRSVALSGTGLAGTASANLDAMIAGFYEKILGRAPDAAGAAFWKGEVARLSALGVSANEVFFAMAYAFFASPEYAAGDRSDIRFATDLYRTLFLRDPDAAGLAFWVGQLQAGKPRGALLNDFLLSPEFSNLMTLVFGAPATRAEVSMVMDFYRGAFQRLPDDFGFIYWLARFRAAQCLDAAAVAWEANVISAEFLLSPEFAARQAALPPAQRAAAAVTSLYNMVLRRGGDFAGFQFWTDQAYPPGGLEFVRRQFVLSPEFQGRVAAVVAQGCAI